MEFKRCSVCKETKNISEFGLVHGKPFCQCRACKSEKDRAYRNKHRDKVLAQKKAYYENNKEALLLQQKGYYEKNKVTILRQQSEYYVENKDRRKEYRKKHYADNRQYYLQSASEWRMNNKARASARDAAYRAKHRAAFILAGMAYYQKNSVAIRERARSSYQDRRDLILARRRLDYQTNKHKHKTWYQTRRARLKNAPGNFSPCDVLSLYAKQKGLCVACRRRLRNEYDVDHIMPLKLGGSNYIHNIQLLCGPCNASKQARHPLVFMRERGFLL